MCGIAGILDLTNNGNSFEKEIVAMTDEIHHRGPDGYGHWHSNNIALGHRRLSILDLTDNATQPMKTFVADLLLHIWRNI